jgi:glycosyltransferase involved in cell wall biosynthesis
MRPGESDNKPLVTVVTVVRNGVGFVEQTIRSVLDSGYKNVAYIVVDGGSTDGTVDIIRKYADRLAWWTSEPDQGIYDAMNKGWAAAQESSLVLFLGAGDLLLSLPADLPRFGPEEVIYGDVHVGKRLFRANAGFELRCNNSLHHQALLVPKALHPAPPFDTSFRVYADFDFNQRLLKQGVKFVYCADLQAYALPGGLSSSKAHRETLAIVSKNFGPLWRLLALCFLALRKPGRLLTNWGANKAGQS